VSVVAALPIRRGGRVVLALLLPGLAYLTLFFLVPFVSLIVTSLMTPLGPGQFAYSFRVQNYVESVGQYLPVILRSFGFALLATVLALAFSYPLAYVLAVRLRRFPLLQALGLVLVVAPFFISFLLRTLAWKQILSDNGPVVGFLQAVAILPPDARLTGTAFSVVFGLAYNFIPFMALPIYASLERLDLRLLEAADDLYARPSRTFLLVTLPLSLPGVVSGTLLTFIPAAGDYINASRDFLGGTSTAMVGNVIETNFLTLENFPVAASLSIVLMAVILVLVGLYLRRVGTRDLV